MKYSGAKLLEIQFNGKGRYFLPDDRILYNKKIQAIIPIIGINPIDGEKINSIDNCFINLTKDGQLFFYQNSLYLMDLNTTQGKFDNINSTLSMPNCFIDVTDDIIGTLPIVFLYEEESAINSTHDISSNFDTFEILITNSRRIFFDDNRLLVGKKFRNFLATFPTITPNGNTAVSSDIQYNAYITLCKGSNKIWERMPLFLLKQDFFIEKLNFQNIEFDFENSYIEVINNDDVNKYLTIAVEYER